MTFFKPIYLIFNTWQYLLITVSGSNFAGSDRSHRDPFIRIPLYIFLPAFLGALTLYILSRETYFALPCRENGVKHGPHYYISLVHCYYWIAHLSYCQDGFSQT